MLYMKEVQEALHNNCLELGRKMTIQKNNFSRIAIGSNKVHSLKMGYFDNFTGPDKRRFCEFVKAGIYDKGLKPYKFKKTGAGSMQQLMQGLIQTELKQEPLIQLFYDIIKSQYKGAFVMYLGIGTYEVPPEQKKLYVPGHITEDENCSIYNYLVGAVCKPDVKKPIAGFLYPAFDDRDSNIKAIDVFSSDKKISISKIFK